MSAVDAPTPPLWIVVDLDFDEIEAIRWHPTLEAARDDLNPGSAEIWRLDPDGTATRYSEDD